MEYKKIQDFGEQHPLFHSKEMNKFRAKGKAKSQALKKKMRGSKEYERKIKAGVNFISNGKVDSKMSRLFGLDK